MKTYAEQYKECQDAHPDVTIFFKVGDFWEVWGDKAEIVAKALEITLTGRSSEDGTRVPMCGVPYHSVEKYLVRLLQLGIKTALCEPIKHGARA